jgi:hypothetical protein
LRAMLSQIKNPAHRVELIGLAEKYERLAERLEQD